VTATKLRKLMDREQLTAQALAQAAGVSVATIHSLCQGVRYPSWVLAAKLAKALDKTKLQVFALCEPQETKS
jgi:DNA-binding XRE family transcriptional regulator